MDFQHAHQNIYHDECEPFPMVGRDSDSQWKSALCLGFSLFHLLQTVFFHDDGLLREFSPRKKKETNRFDKYLSAHIFKHSFKFINNYRPFTTELEDPSARVYITEVGEEFYATAWEFFRRNSASVEVVLEDNSLVRPTSLLTSLAHTYWHCRCVFSSPSRQCVTS